MRAEELAALLLEYPRARVIIEADETTSAFPRGVRYNAHTNEIYIEM